MYLPAAGAYVRETGTFWIEIDDPYEWELSPKKSARRFPARRLAEHAAVRLDGGMVGEIVEFVMVPAPLSANGASRH
jgi:hypothetical protein